MKQLCLAIISVVILLGATESNAGNSQQYLKRLAFQAQETTLSDAQMKQVHKKLASLSPDDAQKVAKYMRDIALASGIISDSQSKALPTLDALDVEIKNKIATSFGSEKNIWNLTPDEFSNFENLVENDAAIKDLITKADYEMNNVTGKFRSAASSCSYSTDWGKKFTRTTTLKSGVTASSSGRVRNSSSDWMCDFVLYVPANKYSYVYGRSAAVQSCILTWGGFNGLSATSSKNAAIIGYGRVAACTAGLGLSESYLKYYVLFK